MVEPRAAKCVCIITKRAANDELRSVFLHFSKQWETACLFTSQFASNAVLSRAFRDGSGPESIWTAELDIIVAGVSQILQHGPHKLTHTHCLRNR
jgi:hypothetical protein